MKAWNSTLKRGTSQLKRTPMKRKPPKTNHNAKSRSGLAQRIAESLGRAIKHAKGESSLLRSEQHRRNVAALGCVSCGAKGQTQAAHANFSKGMGIKSCDSQLMALCVECHRQHDSGGVFENKRQRWKKEVELVDLTRAELISRSLWSAPIEEAYRRAYEPMKEAAS